VLTNLCLLIKKQQKIVLNTTGLSISRGHWHVTYNHIHSLYM
jgi:hypothetical protein